MSDIAPPEPDEQGQFDSGTRILVDEESPKRPARTVHLPPEDVQEQRLHHRHEDVLRPASSGVDKTRRASQAEAASSPSSTVGAYSAATPMPPQDSPDTSPDSESADADIPAEFRPSPAEQRAKDEHDRHLAAQKAIARQAALGDLNTPDDQLRWEEREAAAREAEEKSAREERKGPEPDDPPEPAAIAEDLAPAHPSGIEDAPADLVDTQKRPIEADSDTGVGSSPSKIEQARPISSASSLSRPVSRSHLPMSDVRRNSEALSIGPTQRSSKSPQLHRRRESMMAPVRRPTVTVITDRTFNPARLSKDLANLQGADQDSDRDYLEPLFRIQAHDLPNSGTSALPELLRGAYKTVSTDDHFNQMHERMEYRILRRIYQLQNANKWSLRQMDKVKEPSQPVSHHDHMMAEMKWMCKDFRAERKRKKSVCAWLATRCAEWVAADHDERLRLQVRVRSHPLQSDMEEVPELDHDGDSPLNIEFMPGTPRESDNIVTRLIVDAELVDDVRELQQRGMLSRALKHVPAWQPNALEKPEPEHSKDMTSVSKFVNGKLVPKIAKPIKKRSRYDYEEGEDIEEHPSKRSRDDTALPPEDPNVAIFHLDNKPIRDRLHAANAFRPPSEFQMPSVSFYETRSGSQWVIEDDQKLRKLAKEHTFNWSIIADQMQLPSRFKSGAERRTPWECFERWVELEQMPAEMRKTVYFKTWYARLEQSQQAVEKRYQAQLAQVQAQTAASGNPPQHMPTRRRTQPTRVEKRLNRRYLWTIDAMRRNAKKREMAAFKQAEGELRSSTDIDIPCTDTLSATKVAIQRKASQQNDTQQPRQQMLTPQQFSQKRYERDCQVAEMQRQHRQKLIEASQRQAHMARNGQGLVNGTTPQQRQAGSQSATQQAQMQAATQQQINTAQLTPQQRQALQNAARNGQLNASQSNGQNVPQAQMQTTPNAQPQQNLNRIAAQMQAQGRNGQLNQQQQMLHQQQMALQNGSVSTQQQLANNAALLAAYQAQQQQHQNGHGSNQAQTPQQHGQTHQTSASPSMPPPPAPAAMPGQLSSGHVPALIAIKNHLRNKYPTMGEEQLAALATDHLKSQSTNQARQNALNAAAGMTNPQASASQNTSNTQAYAHNQTYQNGGNANGYGQLDGSTQVNSANGMTNSPQQYAVLMRQRQLAQMRLQQQSPNPAQVVPNSSPSVNHASPNMAPVSPSVQFAGPNMGNQRPPSRSATPQMQRLGSSGSVPGVAGSGMQSPGALVMQSSPRSMQANMAR